MPTSGALPFASALTLTLQFLIFAYLYSSHRVRFFRYLVVAWGLMSLPTGLHFARYLVPGAELRAYPGAGHVLFLTHVAQFNEDLIAFAKA